MRSLSSAAVSELTAQQQANIELGSSTTALWLSGDIEGTLERLTDDIEIVVPNELGNPGHFTGKDAFLGWIGEWDEAWTDFSYEARARTAAGERHVVAEMDQRATGRASGVEVERTVAFLFEIRDGKIAALHLYSTVEEALAVAREREAAVSP
jgi:ketosteroid isomerase-like protein